MSLSDNIHSLLYAVSTNSRYRRSVLLSIAEEIAEKTRFYAPVDTGNLKESIKVRATTENVMVECTASYSLFVHENLENIHKKPTRAKFLEDAAYEVANKYNGAYTVSIEYSPVLRVYIDSKLGENIHDKRRRDEGILEELRDEMSRGYKGGDEH